MAFACITDWTKACVCVFVFVCGSGFKRCLMQAPSGSPSDRSVLNRQLDTSPATPIYSDHLWKCLPFPLALPIFFYLPPFYSLLTSYKLSSTCLDRIKSWTYETPTAPTVKGERRSPLALLDQCPLVSIH
ncbi:hypothetical protein RRG08_011862 [Elysia crispata]|uniref:Uncharacterized protein n=1 Tax=Elysia crispata TaxID=231223 RepID=A0AAE0ZM14_9GAST|nr:hypothetical protein RRG08_011862 [Elysia crispata]